MRVRSDGSVQSSSTPTYQNTSVGRELDHGVYRCMVTRVIFVDDSANITKNSQNPRVLYECVILGGFESGQKISNCRLSSPLGGNFNYFERVLRASSKKLGKDRLAQHDGDIVYVQFVQGHTGYPLIIALDEGISTKGKGGATKSDGLRLKSEFNGIYEEINKDGEWIFRRKGGKYNSQDNFFEPADAIEAEISFKKDKIELGDPNSKISITKSGDKVEITTKGGANVLIDGKNSKITLTKGSTIIELDGNGDKIALKGGFVDLGASVSDFAVLFTELLTTFNQHTHMFPYSAGPSPAVGVTQPPIAPMLQTVGSTTVKVQP